MDISQTESEIDAVEDQLSQDEEVTDVLKNSTTFEKKTECEQMRKTAKISKNLRPLWNSNRITELGGTFLTHLTESSSAKGVAQCLFD